MSEAVDFTNPPVTETMLGAWFAPLPWNSSVLGLYRELVRTDYPLFEDAPMLPSPNVFMAVFPATSRGVFVAERRDVLVQLQPTMLYVNWRRLGENEDYPRYYQQRARFFAEWERFRSFLISEKLPSPIVSACQVSYVNHVELHEGERQGDVLARVLAPGRAAASARVLAEATDINITTTFRSDHGGDMNIQLVPVLRSADNRKMLQMTLSANRLPQSTTPEALAAAFDDAHTELIAAFINFTSDEARQEWGQE